MILLGIANNLALAKDEDMRKVRYHLLLPENYPAEPHPNGPPRKTVRRSLERNGLDSKLGHPHADH